MYISDFFFKKSDDGKENYETMDEENNQRLPLNVRIYGAVLLTLIFISGCIGNIITILAITLYAKLREKVLHVLILTVAICGLLLDIIVIPTLGLHVIEHWPVWPLSKNVCMVVSFITNTCTSMMVLMLLLFSVDRYFVIVRQKMMHRNRVIIVISILTIITMCLHGGYIFPGDSEPNRNTTDDISVCNEIDGEILDEDVRIPILTTTIVHALASLISVLILIKVSLTWWQRKNANLNSPMKSIENDLKGAALIIGGYIAFWIPYWILLIFRTQEETRVRMVVISFILSLMTTAIAPFSAVMFLKNIRLTIINIVTGCKQSDCCTKSSNESDMNPLNQTGNSQARDNPQIFVKGKFKRGTKRIAMDSVSIASSEFSREESPGEDNDSYDDLKELQPQRVTVF